MLSGILDGAMASSLRENAIVGGRYRLDARLGQGGMGVVWSVTHTVTRRRYAMKFVRSREGLDDELSARLMREARAASSVQHPNVVQVHDVFELDDGTPVMVMDLLQGETLRAVMQREGPLSLVRTAELMLPVVSAVGAAHAVGVVHRDLKPDNIFLTGGGDAARSVRVLDFGIAKLSGGDAEGGALTSTGALLGTPWYMAPEQGFGRREIDHRADLWSIGVILYEALSGERPVSGDNLGQVLEQLSEHPITPIEHRIDDLPGDVAAMVTRLLSRDRRDRPRDLREVLAVLRRHCSVSVPDFEAPNSMATATAAVPSGAAAANGRDSADPLGETEVAPDPGPPARGGAAQAYAIAADPTRRWWRGWRILAMVVAVPTGLVAAAGAYVAVRGETGHRPDNALRAASMVAAATAGSEGGAGAVPAADCSFPDPSGSFGTEACVRCAEQQCAQQTADLGVRWSDLTSCQARCSDPGCIEACLAAGALPRRIAAGWKGDGPAVVQEGALPVAITCIADRCAEQCAPGRDFSCVGDYEFGSAATGHSEALVRVQSGWRAEPVSGVTVDVCRIDDLDCGQPIASAVSDGLGLAELTFDVSPALAGPGSLFLRARGTDSSYPTSHHLPAGGIAPVHVLGIAPRRLTALWMAREGTRRDPSMSYFFLFAYDCENVFAPGLKFEVEEWRGGDWVPCERCRLYYSNHLGYPDTQFRETQPGAAAVWVNHVRSGRVRFAARDVASGRVVARATATGLPGHLQMFALTPLTRRQVRMTPGCEGTASPRLPR